MVRHCGLFVAPTTLITLLCYFYGYVATRTYFSYFGVDTDAIGFTTTDYVMKKRPGAIRAIGGGLAHLGRDAMDR